MNLEIISRHQSLANHPMYKNLNSLQNVRTFMQYHVFAVWDFMSLLKSLQRKLTDIELPWTGSKFNPETVRLINEIVLAEESDIDKQGNAVSHFDLYIQGMEEIGADTSLIMKFLKDFEFNLLPNELRRIVGSHLDIAINGEAHEVASSFFYGREKLIPEMFQSIVDVMNHENIHCPKLMYYLERHIELDGDDHGPKALQCLKVLIDTPEKEQEVIKTAIKSLDMRWELWDFINTKIDS